MDQRVLDYARPQTRRLRPRPLVSVPARVAQRAAVVSLLCAIAALMLFPKYMAVRSYEPWWYEWVTPALTLVALSLALVAALPDEQRRRAGGALRGAALAFSLACTAGLLFAPRIIVCGERSDRVKCASNLRQLALGMLLYGQRHGGRLPPDLPTLYLAEDLTAEPFVCPVSGDDVAGGDKTPALAAKLTGKPHCSYVYVGAAHTTAAPADVVLAYEPPSNHSGDGANVLFGDGHVEFIIATRLPAVLAPTTKPATQPLAAPMPATQPR